MKPKSASPAEPSSIPVDEPSAPDPRSEFRALPAEEISAAELFELCRPSIEVDLPLAGRRIRLKGRSLTAAELAQVESVTLTLVPPLAMGADGKKEPDPTNPRFLEELNRLNRQKAALAVVLAYPMLGDHFAAARKTGLADLADAVENALSRDVIEFLFLRATGAGRLDIGLVDFS